MTSYGNETSPYGPAWYLLAGLPSAVGGEDLVRSILAFKVLATVFFVGSTGLLYLILHRARPGQEVPGLILFAWNPLVLFEIVVNAHNDVVMIFFALLALWATLARRWWLVPVALTLVVLTKYALVILAPLLLVYALRTEGRRVWRPVAIGSAVSLALAGALIAPLWQGPDTLHSMQGALDRWHASPAALMYAQLTLTHTPAEAARLTKALMTVLFLAGYGWLLWRRSRDRVQVLETSALGIFGLLLLMSWWFLPWYILWALPLAALSVGRPIGRIGLVLSCTALLSYAPIAWGRLLWYADPTFELELSRVLLIWTVPLLLFLVELLRPLRGPRMIAVQTALRGWNTGEVSGRRVRPLRNAR
jgi:hypothetical protein